MYSLSKRHPFTLFSLLFRRQLNYRTFLGFRILELLRIHYHFQPAEAKYKSGSSNNSLKIWGTANTIAVHVPRQIQQMRAKDLET